MLHRVASSWFMLRCFGVLCCFPVEPSQFMLRCGVLRYIVLRYVVLCCVMLCCDVLLCVAVLRHMLCMIGFRFVALNIVIFYYFYFY